MTKRELAVLRKAIDEIDHELVELLARRAEVVAEIGLIKKKDKLPVRDAARERQVISSFTSSAASAGIRPQTARKLARLIVAEAVTAQKDNRTKDEILRGKSVLVVGGAGRMGEWACRFFSSRGADVKVWDPRRKLAGYTNTKHLAQAAVDAHIVVVASPLGACSEELGMVVSAFPRGIVFDLCSVKAHIASQLRRAAKEGLRITSVHPMFGPKTVSLRGHNIIVCACGSKAADDEVVRLFSRAGAAVSRVSLDRHDELMTYVLGLSHLCVLAFAATAERSGIRLADLREVQGPTFEKLAGMAADLSNESRRVYHDIQALNPNTRHMISKLEGALADLRDAATDADPERFRKAMDINREYLEVGSDG